MDGENEHPERVNFRRGNVLRRFGPYGGLVALALLFFADGVLGGRAFFLRDIFAAVPTLPQLASQTLKTDEWLPWWNPFRGLGKPYIADPEGGYFYPPNWIYYIFTPGRAIVWHGVFHLSLLASSLYALARHWKLSILPAFFAASTFTFSAGIIVMMEFRAPFGTAAWGPLELLLASRLIEACRTQSPPQGVLASLRANIGTILLLTGTLALQYLAGHPQVMLNALLLVAAYIAARALWLRRLLPLAVTTLALGLAGALALGMCMIQFLPSWEFIQLSERSVAIDPQLDMASVHPSHWLTFIFPFLEGRAGYPHEFWGRTLYEYSVGACYLGVLPLLLSLYALKGWRRPTDADAPSIHDDFPRFLTCFFAMLGVGGLVLAAGKYTPAYMALYHYLPGFSHFRWPGKFLIFFVYSISFLAALGLERLLAERNRGCGGRVRGIIFVGAGATLAIAGGYAWGAPRTEFWSWLTGSRFVATPAHLAEVSRDFARTGLFVLGATLLLGAGLVRRLPTTGWAVALITFSLADLFIVSRQIHPVIDQALYAQRAEVGSLLPAARETYRVHSVFSKSLAQVTYGIRDPAKLLWARNAGMENSYQSLGVFDSYQGGMKLLSWSEAFRLLSSPEAGIAERQADLMNIRFVINGTRPSLALLGDGRLDVTVQERSAPLPRAYLVNRWSAPGDHEAAKRLVFSSSFDPRREVVIEVQPDQNPPGPAIASDEEPGTISHLEYKWNSVRLEAVVHHRAILVLSDTWFPGWEVTVSGVEQPILRANLFFRGLLLEPGSHHIVFSYRPQTIQIGAVVSGLTVAAVTLLLGWHQHDRRTRAPRQRVAAPAQ